MYINFKRDLITIKIEDIKSVYVENKSLWVDTGSSEDTELENYKYNEVVEMIERISKVIEF